MYQTSPKGTIVGRSAKRLLDVLVAAIGLVLLAVPFVLVGIAIKLDSKGPVFIRMARIGKDGQPFMPWKFRTMIGPPPKARSAYRVGQRDGRLTRVGSVLRKFSVDELPSLINVLKGEMGLVGPRPLLPYQIDEHAEYEQGRVRVKPGITGLAVISGRNAIPWAERVRLDNWYIDHWTIWLDLKILAATPWKVVTQQGIFAAPKASDGGDTTENSFRLDSPTPEDHQTWSSR